MSNCVVAAVPERSGGACIPGDVVADDGVQRDDDLPHHGDDGPEPHSPWRTGEASPRALSAPPPYRASATTLRALLFAGAEPRDDTTRRKPRLCTPSGR